MTGEMISAAKALEIGLVNNVVPKNELMPATLNLAKKINQNGPLAVRAVKEAVYKGIQMPLNDAFRFETLLIGELRESEDAWEGPKAFAEKRTPVYKGR
jgi:enoyl-CoA hydratase/carnithine racemase